jgi:AcrR family transcriptional regulator
MLEPRKGANTKTQILDAAEKRFAKQGFEATSLRAIIADAGVNLAAIHYHFRSKEGLVRAVLQRRFAPINDERIRQLEACQRRPRAKAAQVEEILEAFLAPPLYLGLKHSFQGRLLMQLMGRVLLQSGEMLERAAGDQFLCVATRFLQAFQQALPHLSKQEIAWRLNFTIGAAAKALFGGIPMKILSEATHENLAERDLRRILRKLIAYTAAGMKAPAVREN